MPSSARIAAAVALVATGSLVLPAVAQVSPARGPAPADTVRIELHVEPGSVVVRATYPATSLSDVTLALWPWAGVDLSEAVSGVEATDAGGRALLVRRAGPHEWQLPLDGRAFTVRHRIPTSKETFIGETRDDLFGLTATGDLAVGWGHAWFLRPQEEELARLPVRVTLTGSYAELELIGGTEGVFPDRDALTTSFLVGGDARRVQAPVGGGRVPFVLVGDDWSFSDEDFVGAVGDIMTAQAAAMGFTPDEDMTVVLLEGASHSSGGTVEGAVIAVYPDPGVDLFRRDPESLRLLAHEYFHLWNGRHAEGDPEREGRYKWFQEGLTEYMAHRSLVATGFVEPGDFVFKVNQFIDRYVRNPGALTATADSLEHRYWVDRDYQRLPYDKGFLLGLALDARIQEVTAGQADIVDYLKAVIRPNLDGFYDDGTLLAALEETTATTDGWGPFYQAYMLGAEPLAIEELCLDAGFDCEADGGGPVKLMATERTRSAMGRLLRQ